LEVSLITPHGAPISHLILTTKSPSTAAAITPLLPRLGPGSTILFTQNGVGAVEEVDALFPAGKKPTYLSAIVTHGVFSTGQFSATHAGVADLKIGPVLAGGGDGKPLSAEARWLMDTILASEALAAREVEAGELLRVTLEKLVANAVINPLTAIFRIPNGGVLDPSLAPLRKALVEEASAVILAHLSTLSAVDAAAAERFSAEALGRMVEGVCTATSGNRSSMLQDVEAGRGTEVGYINGWIVRKGRELGVETGVNEVVLGMVERGEVRALDEAGELVGGVV
ncbi:hypothetical protein O988_06168, partial [Pseudogymnoascus sp. VKM F-3808]